MMHTYEQTKKAATKTVNKADVYSKLDEDGGKRKIYKMARDKERNNKDVKGATLIK